MPDSLGTFEQVRPMLTGLAYRMLGSRADAEDAVQDTFLKWQATPQDEIERPAAWLTTACTRRCIDLLRSAHRTRVDYVGPWLPEPIHTPVDDMSDLQLASSLTTAFLLMLERLTPKERAAYLLHEIFDIDYPEIATILEMQESACRKLVSRARANIDQDKVRHETPRERQRALLAAFETAVTSGEINTLATLLSEDIRLAADSGGKVADHPARAARQVGGAGLHRADGGPLLGHVRMDRGGYQWRPRRHPAARGRDRRARCRLPMTRTAA